MLTNGSSRPFTKTDESPNKLEKIAAWFHRGTRGGGPVPSREAPHWQDELLETAVEARLLAGSFGNDQAACDLKAFAACLERDACRNRPVAPPSRDETVPSV